MTIFYDDCTAWLRTENWEYSEDELQRLEILLDSLFDGVELPDIDK